MLIGDILRKCLRTACRLDDAEEPAVEKVDASKREVSIAPKPRSTFSRRSFKVPSRAARAAPSRASRRVEPLQVGARGQRQRGPLKSVLSRRDKESTITKSVMDMFVRSTRPAVNRRPHRRSSSRPELCEPRCYPFFFLKRWRSWGGTSRRSASTPFSKMPMLAC